MNAPTLDPESQQTLNLTIAAMKSAFLFGYRCCEKGMNIQDAAAHYDGIFDATQPESASSDVRSAKPGQALLLCRNG